MSRITCIVLEGTRNIPTDHKCDIDQTLSSSSLESIPNSAENERKRVMKTVGFNRVQIRFYDQTIGYNPSTSDGPPISLDWKYNEEDAIQIDDYEFGRPRRRYSDELRLSNHLRRNILMKDYGLKAAELNCAVREATKTASQRRVTRRLLPICKVEEMVESCKRKARQVIRREKG